LWTPPYWEFAGGGYHWHHGYWGLHIGFYGGINYGFGYVGRGFYGGYWNSGAFVYNQAVTNVNTTVIRNVYNYRVTNYTPANRVSFNGGARGVQMRPSPQELAVVHDQRMAPVAAQLAQARNFAGNRAQFASANGGRPAELVASRPLQTPYRAPAARPAEVPERPAVIPARPAEAARAQNFRPPELRPQGSQMPTAPSRDFRPQAQPGGAPGNRMAVQTQPPAPRPDMGAMQEEQARSQAQQRAQEQARAQSQHATPQPDARPQFRQENRPAPVERQPQFARPAPQAAPQPQRPEFRPAPQPQPAAAPPARPEFHPAPQAQPRPEFHPAPQAQPPQAHREAPHAEPPHKENPQPNDREKKK
jgi:hypothetical protein